MTTPDEWVSLEELATGIEPVLSTTLPDSRAVARPDVGTTADLHHRHLPKLDGLELLDYDRHRGVRYRPHEPLEELLWFIEERLDDLPD